MKDALLYSAVTGRLLLRPLVRLGWWNFQRTGRTLGPSYSSFRKLHCVTRGALNAELSAKISRAARPIDFGRDASGVLGRGPALLATVDRAVDSLHRDGFYVFPERLGPDACAELTTLATETPALLLPPAPGCARARFDQAAPLAPRYFLHEADLIHSAAACHLLADASIMVLAQRYLAAPPIIDLLTMWWSVPHGGTETTQLFHFDMDRIRFLKFFVYLTDVGPDQGPHVYVRGSHRKRPAGFFRDRRFTDREVGDAFPVSDICELAGPAGTMFAADTSGLHKGKPLAHGRRLVAQLELTNSLFGQTYQRHAVDRGTPLAAAIQRFPHVLQRFEVR